MQKTRNVVLITLDSVRADHCSCYGYRRLTTPTLNKLAKKSLFFKNAMAAGVPTLPSMFSMFTGDYALVNADVFTGKVGKMWRDEIRHKETLASKLSKLGYSCLAFTANPFATKYFGLNKGFSKLYDPYGIDISQNQKVCEPLLAKELQGEGKGSIIELLKDIIVALKVYIKEERLFTPWEKYYDLILNKIRETHKPFFSWILLVDTHIPYVPKVNQWWSNKIVSLYLCYKVLKKAGYTTLGRRERKLLINAYDNAIVYADMFIKLLLEDLQEYDPLFIIHADHGEGFGEHNFYMHPPKLYGELLHVPLLFYNLDNKFTVKQPISLMDMATTIFRLASKNELAEHLFQKKYIISKVFDRGFRKLSIIYDKWKFMTGESKKPELYNIHEDKYEKQNLYEEYPDLVRLFTEICNKHIKSELEKRRIRAKFIKT